MSDDWKPRPGDELVEPFFGGLEVGDARAREPQLPPRLGRELALVSLAALALAVLWLWPLPLHLTDSLPHDPRFLFDSSDVHLGSWACWWAREALEGGANPFFCDAIYLPEGHSLAFHTHGMLWGALSIPLQWMGGAVFAANAMLFLLLVATAAAVWALARNLGLGRLGSAVAAFGWSFSPYFLQKSFYHLCYFASPWPPLFCLGLVWWMNAPRRRPALRRRAALLAGFSIAACAWTSTMVTLYTLIAGVLLVLVAPSPIRSRRRGTRRGLLAPGPWLLGVGTALVLASPMLVELSREWGAMRGFVRGEVIGELAGAGGGDPQQHFNDIFDRSQPYRPHLEDFLGPADHHPLFGAVAGLDPEAPYDPDVARSERLGMSVGLSTLALVLAGLVLVPRARRWALVGLPLFLMAWDPGGDPSGWVSALYKDIPPFSGIRFIARAWPLALLFFFIAGGLGADGLLAQPRRRWAAYFLPLVLVFEFWIGPYPTTEVALPEAVERLAELDDPGGVCVLPYLDQSRTPMTWQTVHGKPVIMSYIARPNPGVLAQLYLGLPALVQLIAPSGALTPEGSLILPPVEEVAADLDRAGVSNLLFRSDLVRNAVWREQLAEYFDGLPGWGREPTSDAVLWWGRTAD